MTMTRLKILKTLLAVMCDLCRRDRLCLAKQTRRLPMKAQGKN